MEKTPVDVVIVGSGFSGLGLAIQLKRQGRDSFVILEKANEVGGTWRDNTYPGCACDVPSHLYSFSFEPNPSWSRMYAPQEEILAYLKRCADKYDVRRHVSFGQEVVEAVFDEASGVWRIRTRAGLHFTARHLALGVGALHRPEIPQLPGRERFRGRTFHSAEWDHAAPLDGRIAVIGTGASAIQFVPKIAESARRLLLFQRTPPWILPRPDRGIGALERGAFARVPLAQQLARWLIYWRLEAMALGFVVNPRIMKLVEVLARRHIAKQIPDEALRRKVTPDYTPGCKRILLSDDYYPALARENVEVITDGIRELTERGVVTNDGVEHAVDTVIYGTGFKVTEMLTSMRVVGRGGVELNESWRGGIEAYRGTLVAGFPHLYLLMGPNTGLGHNSMVFMLESQMNLVLSQIAEVERSGARFADVRPQAQAAWNRALVPRLQRAVWASGCRSWYLDANGRNSALWPGFTFEFRARTRRVKRDDLEMGL